MTNKETPAGPPSAVVAAQLRYLRRQNGLTVQDLAKRCADVGNPELTATMIYNIESGRPAKDGNRRRHVTVDELMTLAVALDLGADALLYPHDGEAPYQPTPTTELTAERARAWARGIEPIDPKRRRDTRYLVAKLAEHIAPDDLAKILADVGEKDDNDEPR
jgi:transcriptional regulator with XRE-family HTH domain